VAKARIDLKGVNRAVNKLASNLAKLQTKAANRASEKEMKALHQKLTRIRTMMADECPKVMFRSFDIASPTMARLRKARVTRKRTTKGR
jgi:hypothetical protein